MQAFETLRDLEPYGIIPLTGEACGLSYRYLCDLTEKGKKIVEKTLSVSCTSQNWNHGSDSDPHVASIMLPHELTIPLAVFATLENGFTEVDIFQDINRRDYRIVIAYDNEKEMNAYREDARTWLHLEKLRTLRYQGTAGDRNIHEMSGRIS